MARTFPGPGGALGVLETVGLVAAIEAADAMLKTSEVRLVRQQRTVPGLVTHFVVGDTAAVRSAVDAGAA
ncbi:BMC domain-containing protein, partial [Rubrivirga sp.]|uniref:BMC domain-containing protein n=1 Tax=Rubrivirga sp. TaxID=1885344 RepID=UPI003C761A7D